MVSNNQLLSEALDLLTRELIISLPNDLRQEINQNFQSRAKSSNIYKYERKFLGYLLARKGPKSPLFVFTQQLRGQLESRLIEDFSVENLLSHYRLVRRGLIEKYFSIFLLRQFRSAFSSSMNALLSFSGYMPKGNFHGSTMLLHDLSSIAYQKICETLADKYMNYANSEEKQNGLNTNIPDETLKFVVKENKFSYSQPIVVNSSINEVILQELKADFSFLTGIIIRLSNKFPRLLHAFQKYQAEILRDTPDPSVLFIFGSNIQAYVTRHADSLRSALVENAESDELANDALDALDTFLFKHALFVMSAPDIRGLIADYEKLKEIVQETGDRKRIFEPFFNTVNSVRNATKLFDEQTVDLAGNILNSEAAKNPEQSEEAAAAALTKGVVAGIGRYAKTVAAESGKEIGKAAGREVGQELGKQIIYAASQKSNINREIFSFIMQRKEDLARIAAENPVMFGWIGVIVSWYVRNFKE